MVGLIGPTAWASPACWRWWPARGHPAGQVQVLGGDMASVAHRNAVCPRIAYMPQGLGKNLYPTLSVEENLQFFAACSATTRPSGAGASTTLTRSTGLHPSWTARPASCPAA
jgi:ribosome-dependent ATPase